MIDKILQQKSLTENGQAQRLSRHFVECVASKMKRNVLPVGSA
jgi:hypothetical protein